MRERGSIETRVKDQRYLIRWWCSGCQGQGEKPQPHTDMRRHNQLIRGDWNEANNALSAKLKPQEPIKPKPTFASYMDDEWAHYVHDNWKASTQVTQGSFVRRHIRPYFDAMILEDIKATDIVAFHKTMSHLSTKTRRTIHTILGTMFSNAVEQDIIAKSPVKRRGQAPKVEKKEKRALNDEQAWELWDALNTPELIRVRALYGVLLFTQIRTGEALGLKWSDIDFANHTLTVRRAIFRGQETTPKTDASLRKRVMVPDLYAAMLNHRTMATFRQPNDYVFASKLGTPLNTDMLREKLQGVLRDKMGILFGPRQDGLHLLRHTGGSMVYRKRGVKAAQEALGHKSPRVTLEVYAHETEGSALQIPLEVFQRPAVVGEPDKKAN